MCAPAMCSVSASHDAKLSPQPAQRHACAAADEQSCCSDGDGDGRLADPLPGAADDGDGAEDGGGCCPGEEALEKASWARLCEPCVIDVGETGTPRWSRSRWLVKASIITNGSPDEVDGPRMDWP